MNSVTATAKDSATKADSSTATGFTDLPLEIRQHLVQFIYQDRKKGGISAINALRLSCRSGYQATTNCSFRAPCEDTFAQLSRPARYTIAQLPPVLRASSALGGKTPGRDISETEGRTPPQNRRSLVTRSIRLSHAGRILGHTFDGLDDLVQSAPVLKTLSGILVRTGPERDPKWPYSAHDRLHLTDGHITNVNGIPGLSIELPPCTSLDVGVCDREGAIGPLFPDCTGIDVTGHSLSLIDYESPATLDPSLLKNLPRFERLEIGTKQSDGGTTNANNLQTLSTILKAHSDSYGPQKYHRLSFRFKRSQATELTEDLRGLAGVLQHSRNSYGHSFRNCDIITAGDRDPGLSDGTSLQDAARKSSLLTELRASGLNPYNKGRERPRQRALHFGRSTEERV